MTQPEIRILDAPESQGGTTHQERRAAFALLAERIRAALDAHGATAYVREGPDGLVVGTDDHPVAILLYATMGVYLAVPLDQVDLDLLGNGEEDDPCQR